MPIQMTRKEYEAKYGQQPTDFTVPQITPPIQKMTRAEYNTKYGLTQEEKPNYFQRVASGYEQAGKDIIEGVSLASKTVEKGGTQLEVEKDILRAPLRTVGGVARAAFVPIFEAPGIKQVTEKIAETIIDIPGVKKMITKATDLAIKHPEIARDLRDVVDIATLGVGGTFEKPILREVGAIGKDITTGTKAILTPSEKSIQNKVLSLFQKSIKPTAKKTTKQGEIYNTDVLNALRTIKKNADQLNIEDLSGEIVSRTPQTINELAQGLEQTKKIVFNQYDDLAKRAGTAGAVVDAKPIADELAKVAQNKALQLANPEVIKYAENWEKRLRDFDVLDTETTQEVIKLMNNNLQAFYKNPTYDVATKVSIDAGIANNFRKSLDNVIENATGEQYQVLKNQYKALKAIENDVTRASMRDARKNVKGLLDYTDIFTSGQMIGGILSLNPTMFTKGAIERGFKEYIKFLNDPNRAIDNIFKKLNIDTTKTFEPISATGKFIKSPKVGLGIEDVSKNQEFQRLQSMNKSTQKTINNIPKNNISEDTITQSISKAKASGQSFDEWVKGQTDYFSGIRPTKNQPENLFITKNKTRAGEFGVVESQKLLPNTKIAKINNDSPFPIFTNGKIQGATIPDEIATVVNNVAKEISQEINSITIPIARVLQDKRVIDAAKQAGFDAFDFKTMTPKGDFNAIQVFNKNKLLTRSQLKAEWDKVKK